MNPITNNGVRVHVELLCKLGGMGKIFQIYNLQDIMFRELHSWLKLKRKLNNRICKPSATRKNWDREKHLTFGNGHWTKECQNIYYIPIFLVGNLKRHGHDFSQSLFFPFLMFTILLYNILMVNQNLSVTHPVISEIYSEIYRTYNSLVHCSCLQTTQVMFFFRYWMLERKFQL